MNEETGGNMRPVFMRIREYRIHSIAMADPPLRSSYGLHQPYALRNVIELESEDGIIGIAETYGGEQPAAALEAIRQQVVGSCPYRLTGDLSLMVEGGTSGSSDRKPTMFPVKTRSTPMRAPTPRSRRPALT